MECYLMTGDADYQLRVLTRSLADYEAFLRDRLTRIPGVAKISVELCFPSRRLQDRIAPLR